MPRTKRLRSIIRIDENLCNGCGLCVTACAEGAIEIRDGKARLVSEIYCDGLGACLDECPQGAITIEEREAEDFDTCAVEERKKALRRQPDSTQHVCPGAMARNLQRVKPETKQEPEPSSSALGNWPVQLSLVPPRAPYLKEADLLISADCVAYTLANFHQSLLAGKVVFIGCPKLDDAGLYLEKLIDLFSLNRPSSVEVAYMEVPCCGGLVRIVEEACIRSGAMFPLTLTRLGIDGNIQEKQHIPAARSMKSVKCENSVFSIQ